MVSAKYIRQTVTKNNFATASEFYFESDLLDGAEHEVVPTDTQGTTASVTIRLKNHADDLRYSETAINYTVIVAEKDTDSQAADVTVTPSSGTLAAGKINNADVTISNLQAGKTYTITASTDNVYQKTLTGTIKVLQPDTNVYASVSDKTQYIEVTVWTTDYTGEVKLSYGDIGLVPDNTDAKMSDAQSTGSTITVTDWEVNTSHVFRFFKSDIAKKYKVEVSGQEVTVGEA